MTERWKPIRAWPYEVSDLGRVRHVVTGYILKPTAHPKTGYLSVGVSDSGRKGRCNVHRLVALAFCRGRSRSRRYAAHRDGTKTNNHYKNIRWSTAWENSQDNYLHDAVPFGARNGAHKHPEKRPKGEKHGNSVLTLKIVKKILRSTKPSQVLADQIGVVRGCINNVRSRLTWAHVQL